jgi:hypothetical protein
MQQTILAALALMLVGSFMLNQHRGAMRTYNEIVDDELEIAASGVAMHIMELISNRDFDERTAPKQIFEKGLPQGAAEFTSTSAFGRVGSACDLDEPFLDSVPCTDLDDSHMAPDDWQEVPFRLKDGKELPFDVNVEVFYVDPSDLDNPLPPGATSFHKKVVVKLRAKHHVQSKRYLKGFVRLERIFSFDRKRAENRMKDEYDSPIPTADPSDIPDLGGDNNGGDVYDTDENMEADPDQPIWICHRSVVLGEVTWTTKSVRQMFVEKHISHGDTTGKCTT